MGAYKKLGILFMGNLTFEWFGTPVFSFSIPSDLPGNIWNWKFKKLENIIHTLRIIYAIYHAKKFNQYLLHNTFVISSSHAVTVAATTTGTIFLRHYGKCIAATFI